MTGTVDCVETILGCGEGDVMRSVVRVSIDFSSCGALTYEPGDVIVVYPQQVTDTYSFPRQLYRSTPPPPSPFILLFLKVAFSSSRLI